VSIAAGVTTTVEGVFSVHGWLRILTDPAVPSTIYVNGVPRNDWGMWQSMLPGTYLVAFGAVPGYPTPEAQIAVVTAGQTSVVTGSFRHVP